MKNIQGNLLLMMLVFSPVLIQSQDLPFTFTYGGFTKEKITILSADFQRLKTVTSFNVAMKMDNMRIGNTKHDPDSIYLQRRVNELNADKKSKGDDWLKEWEASKKNYLPVFIEGYNAKRAKTSVPSVEPGENSDFTIVLCPDTITIANAWIASFLSMHLYIVSSKNQNDTIATFKSFTFYARNLSKQYPGFEESAFYMAGDMLVRYFKKYVYKK